MKYFLSAFSIFFTTLAVQGVLAFMRRPRKAEKGKVVLPAFLLIIGLIGSVPFIVGAAYTILTDKPIWVSIILLVFSMLGLSLVVAYINCRITYDEEGFTHKSFFGIKRYYKYEEITAVKYGKNEDFIYIGKRRLMVDELAIGADDFFHTADKQYRVAFGTSLPQQPRNKQMFSPDLPSAGTLIFMWAIIGATGLMLAGLLIFSLITAPPENTKDLIWLCIMIVLSVVGTAAYILVTVNMARFPERYKEKTIRLWLYKDYRRSSSNEEPWKRH